MEHPAKGFTVDWRIALGLILTTVWMTLGVTYLLGIVGFSAFVALPTGEIGSFLEGAFAPLAFLWLVIGHFMQQKEISTNTKAIQVQEQSARRLEMHSRRDSYFKLLSLVEEQLGAIAGFHFTSVCGPTGTQEVSQEEFADMRTNASTGDCTLFIRKMSTLAITHRADAHKLEEIFFGTEIRQRHSNNFENTFNKLLREAESVDTDDMIRNALLRGSSAGMLYHIILHVAGKEPLDTSVTFAPPLRTPDTAQQISQQQA